jgi:hypothetical protein
MPHRSLSPALELVRQKAMRAIAPLKPADSSTRATPDFLFSARRTDAGRQLPPYYLVYFLLVDLLEFRNIGTSEKVAWSVPLDFKGQAFVIEHRKLGLGVFAEDPVRDEAAAREIVIRIQKAVKAAQPFFDALADEAVAQSLVNVVNNSSELFQRYEYLRDQYNTKKAEADRRREDREVTEGTSSDGTTWRSVSFPAYRLQVEASWLAMSAVEAFFSWTEHCFIHLSILQGRIKTAEEVTAVAEADWSVKFKSALDIGEQQTKDFYDRLVAMRQELRNYVAHGAFGKQGEAFSFHSGAGAVPVLLPHRVGTKKFRLGHGLDFDLPSAIELLEGFRVHLWSQSRAPAELYIQKSELPIILTMAADGTYASAMKSVEDMNLLVEQLSAETDRAANMDW